MKKKIALFLLFPLLLSASPKQSLIDELRFVKGVFEAQYAPIRWKEEYAGFNLEHSIGKAISGVESMEQVDLKSYHNLLKHFTQEVGDYHVGVQFYATEEASLPFEVRGAEGRYFFVDIDRTALPYSRFPFSVGDELISFGGEPVKDVVARLRIEEGFNNVDLTDNRLCEMMLTCRSAKVGHAVPSGSLELVGIRRGSGHEISVTVQWYYYPEKVMHRSPVVPLQSNYASWRTNPRKAVEQERFFEKMMVYSNWRGSHVGSKLTTDHHSLGSKVSFVPGLGRRVWSAASDAIFDAHIYEVCGKRVAYVRIPHYMGDEEETEEFCQLMRRFQIYSDALVIDQLNNPGGSVFYLYSLLSTLTPRGQEIATAKHRLLLTQEEVYMALTILESLEGIYTVSEAHEVLGDTLGGYPVSMETVHLMRDFSNFLLDQWSSGKAFTEPTHLFGVDRIKSHPAAVFSKPVVVLTNELDFSAGDFFPAALQDAGRATILGTRTAGAGGYVTANSYPNRSGVADFTVTASIAQRPVSGKPLENLGVTPDVVYQLTADDLQNNYGSYVNKIVETVLDLI
ncbi:MAG: hypothetical protein S4CHLAM81_03670 [Chlamydiales bacterium]|nr:hypothetical protein [Chlamydiales bacterium]MCH9635156.1 hypothetical protein [Chlamydiales bacterium]